jgi:hypothetical protein
MKGDNRARIIVQLLNDLPEGVSITRWGGPHQPDGIPFKPVWEIAYYDEYGERFEDLHVVLAEETDLVRALLKARNRYRSGKAILGT